jgi:hypothetical protein
MMEQGRGDYGSNKTGGWFKDIFKKKEGREDDVATGGTAEDEGVERQRVVQDNLMTLADIGEEDEKEKLEEEEPKTNGSFVGLEEANEATQDSNVLSNGAAMQKMDKEKNEEKNKEKNEEKNEVKNEDVKESVKETEAMQQDNVLVYMAKEEEETEKRGMRGVFGRFMKKINPESEDTVQPPSYSEATNYQEVREPGPSKEEAAEEEASVEASPAKETHDAATQMDAGTQVEEDDMINSEDEPTEDALPESERINENREADELLEETIPDGRGSSEPEPKFRFRFQQFFGDKK